MSERWGTRTYAKQKGLRGSASVRVTKSSVRVAFDTDPENIYEIPLEKAIGVVKPGKWWVSLSAKGDRLYGISPISGIFSLRVKEIAHAQGQPPAPQHYTSTWKDKAGKEGTSEYDGWTLLFEITDGPCAGMTAGMFLRYYFVSSQDGFVLFDKPLSPHTKRLVDTMDVVGAFDKGPMKYTENILPALQARLQAANYPLMGIFKEGQIDSLTRTQNVAMIEEESEEETKSETPAPDPKKKRGRKSAQEIIDEISPQ